MTNIIVFFINQPEMNKLRLIKDALEIYLNQSSSFLSGHEESGLVNPSLPLGFTRAELETAYLSQKEKNEKIVRECKELLSKLEE
ncbi:8987_t:CDS:2 [Funneliformis geosporum]|uniref:8987_t:CDS:1 n=1 Tax=Funneliformis geosporum TaxID=1117311 RepID=A0A9W4SZK6_9GLOM|nr:8987_t:CDS:2 [Funneliformis geosporum]